MKFFDTVRTSANCLVCPCAHLSARLSVCPPDRYIVKRSGFVLGTRKKNISGQKETVFRINSHTQRTNEQIIDLLSTDGIDQDR